jgi:hypothetical protein
LFSVCASFRWSTNGLSVSNSSPHPSHKQTYDPVSGESASSFRDPSGVSGQVSDDRNDSGSVTEQPV